MEIATWISIAATPEFKARVGDPLALVDKKEQYKIWPELERRLPLLFFCAATLLGLQPTSTANERFHSVVGYICTKVWACMAPDMLEYLSLAFAIAKDYVAYPAELKHVQDEALPGYLDLERIDEVLHGMGNMHIGGAAPGHGGAGGAAAGAAMAVDGVGEGDSDDGDEGLLDLVS